MTTDTPRYSIGLDFGTESARAVLVNLADGDIAATCVEKYRHGVMDRALPDGTKLGHEWALQHPKITSMSPSRLFARCSPKRVYNRSRSLVSASI